jgi:hypothetical protein
LAQARAEPDDAMDVEHRPAADWPHWPDRGNGHPHRDRLERRLFRDSEREAELAAAQATIRAIGEAAAEKAAQIERLERAVAAMCGAEPEPVTGSHLLFASTPGGYVLHEGEGDPPAAGHRVRVDGHEYAVAKLASSPLPGDPRRCAYPQPPG